MTPTELYAALKQIQPNQTELLWRMQRKNCVRVVGITKGELARRLGASPRSVSYWFSGKYKSQYPTDYDKIRQWAKEGAE